MLPRAGEVCSADGDGSVCTGSGPLSDAAAVSGRPAYNLPGEPAALCPIGWQHKEQQLICKTGSIYCLIKILYSTSLQ